MIKKGGVAILCFAVTGILFYFAYYGAISAPFYFDDFPIIVENSRVLHSTSVQEAFTEGSWRRALTYVTFWLDYQRAGFKPEAFRLTNYIIHLFVCLGIYFWVKELLKSKAVSSASAWALFAATVFLVHPLFSQSVIYIVQRMASMAALGAVFCCWFTMRTCIPNQSLAIRGAWIILALLTFGVAILSKENALVIPVLAYISARCSYLKLPRSWDYMLLGCIFLAIALVTSGVIESLDRLTRETLGISRWDYFLAQGPIIWSYIAKFFWPSDLRLEYGIFENAYPLWISLVAWLGHGLVIGCAIVVRRKIPLIAAGVFFYYIGHAVESFVVPIRDLVFEHRAYLPSMGLLLVTIEMLRVALKGISFKMDWLVPMAIVVALTLVTHERTLLWLNKDRFYLNELSYNSDNVRVKGERARYFLERERYEQALNVYQDLFNNHLNKIDEGIALNTMLAFLKTEQYEQAAQLEKMVIPNLDKIRKGYQARFYLYRGQRLKAQNNCEEAIKHFHMVQKLYPRENQSLLAEVGCQITVGNQQRAAAIIRYFAKKKKQPKNLVEIYQRYQETFK